ncbi:uncharacterized protein LOC144364283 [Saccoglossus kowalevskii]
MVCNGQLNSVAISLACTLALMPVLFGMGGWFLWIGWPIEGIGWTRFQGYFWLGILFLGAGFFCVVVFAYYLYKYRHNLSMASFRDQAFEEQQRRKAAAQRGEDVPPPKALLKDLV